MLCRHSPLRCPPLRRKFPNCVNLKPRRPALMGVRSGSQDGAFVSCRNDPWMARSQRWPQDGAGGIAGYATSGGAGRAGSRAGAAVRARRGCPSRRFEGRPPQSQDRADRMAAVRRCAGDNATSCAAAIRRRVDAAPVAHRPDTDGIGDSRRAESPILQPATSARTLPVREHPRLRNSLRCGSPRCPNDANVDRPRHQQDGVADPGVSTKSI